MRKLYSTDGHRDLLGEHEFEDLKEDVIVTIKGPNLVKFDKAKIDTELSIVTYFDCLDMHRLV